MRISQNIKSTFNKGKISTDIISWPEKEILSSYSQLTSISKKGLIFHSNRQYLLIPEKDISKFLDQPVELFLSQYELPFHGVIKAIKSVKKDVFEIHIDFMESTPHYYRECMEDLLN